ncbi:MAG: hypothetical protein J0L82_10420 [Deltaproteobacteria bacterium]|jgi:hypothetical protein|nr:hypothetical protein [Deltaproteobacteria bacterium]
MSSFQKLDSDSVEVVVSEQGGFAPKKREQQLSFFKRRPRSPTVEIVERDVKVLDFILDMKFATATEVYEKFFARSPDLPQVGHPTKWTKRRLMQLTRSGFLKSTVGIGVQELVYVSTFKAYYLLNSFSPSVLRPKPTGGLDLRTFVHDRKLLLLRMDFERKHGDVAWISDRRLKQGISETLGIFGSDVPDAVVKLPQVGVVALELEIATKSRVRYREKISRYVRLIRESRSKPDGIRKVIYVCHRKPVFEILRDETRIYGGLFEVRLVEPFSAAKGVSA